MSTDNNTAGDPLDELRQHARELAPETDSFEEFAEMFGMGGTEEELVEAVMDLQLHNCCDCGKEVPDSSDIETFEDLRSLESLGWKVHDPFGVVCPDCVA